MVKESNKKINETLLSSTMDEEVLSRAFGAGFSQCVVSMQMLHKALSDKEIHSQAEVFQMILIFLKTINHKEVFGVHEKISAHILSEMGEEERTEGAVALLSNAIREKTRELLQRISATKVAKEIEAHLHKLTTEARAGFSEWPIAKNAHLVNFAIDGNLQAECSEGGIFIPATELLRTVSDIGPRGEHLRKIAEQDPDSLGEAKFWFDLNKPFFVSEAIECLGKCLWTDSVSKNLEFSKKYPPMSSSKNFDCIKYMMMAEPKRDDKKIELIHAGNSIAAASIPAVASHLVKAVFSGAGKLNTVTGHKALRFSAALPFQQIKNGVLDFRVKEFSGGFAQIAEQIGLTSGNQKKDLREILYAMQHLRFSSLQDGKTIDGNLINLATCRNKNSGRDDGIIITVLPALVGFSSFTDRTLLIPIAQQVPPLEGIANQYHAPMYLLQMLLLEEFSKQSTMLTKEGCIHLPDEAWGRLLEACDIPKKMLQTVKNLVAGKSSEDFRGEAPAVLEHRGGNYYALSKPYSKQSEFLIEQGEIRNKNSERGKKGASKKWKKGKK